MPPAAPIDPAALELRDIHLPDPVGWWPPAPGWWVLAGLLVAAGLALLLLRAWRRRRPAGPGVHALALAELDGIAAAADQLDDRTLAARLSELLRRTVAADPDLAAQAAATGTAWLRALDQTLGDERFTRGAGAALSDAPYRPGALVDRGALLALARDWLEARQAGGTAETAPQPPAATEQAA